ncbi:hypothetical protein ACET3Z_030748 [Daucus carota]
MEFRRPFNCSQVSFCSTIFILSGTSTSYGSGFTMITKFTGSQPQNQLEYPSSAAPAVSFPQFTASVSTTSAYQQMLTSVPDHSLLKQSSQLSQSDDMRSQPSSSTVDKPADDGYNLRS